MIRLLIVDDEPYSVDGLYEMLSELPDLELDLYKAYSAEEAIQRLSRTKIDIVLSDIRMPGMSGIELQGWIHTRWPRCKVIFLTGYSDIEYAQQALRGGGVDYILKTEGDEAIIRAIRHAMDLLEEMNRNEAFLTRAKEHLLQALPVLRKDWFEGLLDPRKMSAHLKNQRLQELQIPLNLNGKVHMVYGRVDRWGEIGNAVDQALLLYAIQNIAVEYLGVATVVPILLEDSQFVWLLQPSGDRVSSSPEEAWPETVLLVQGTLDSIQSTIKSLLKIPVSLACTDTPVSWPDVPKLYAQLRHTLVLGLGDRSEMLIPFCQVEAPAEQAEVVPASHITELERILESGQEQEFEARLDETFNRLPNRFSLYVQAYYAVAVMILGQYNKWERSTSPEDGLKIDRLMDLSGHASREKAIHFLKEAAFELIRNRTKVLDERTNRIVQKLKQYIQAHLDKDLSLEVLADVVYLNPSYLSSLYKQCTGENLSDYIAELRVAKAKALLADSPLKIHEIAEKVGFSTAGYFTRFFKKHTGLTPVEFRGN